MNSFRKDFPIFSGNDVIYFDNAATTQRPVQVLDAMRQFNNSCNANPLRGLYDWSIRATEAYEDARHAAAQFIGADMDCEIVFTRNTTESLNLVAYSYGLSHVHEGDEIVISVMEHHSNILPWQMVCRQTGAKLIYMEPEKDGTLTEQEIRSKITDRTKIVSIAHVSNVLGVTNPVRKIADTAHAHGAVVVVDGAQSTPHIPVNVKELGADFYAFSGHKLCAPMGIGVLYGRKELLEDMPPFLTGGEMIEYVERQTATFADVPEKFEAGTVNAMGAVGLGAAIHYLQGVGFDTIRKTEEELTTRLMDGLSRIPEITVYGSSDPAKHCGIVTFNIEGCHPHDVASVLDTEHIAVRAGHHCAQPLMKWLQVNATTRASLYFYNTEEEVDRFVAAAGKVRGWLGY
ncbi:MAG TPA: cysteine desulfurase [Lachnospiraceae bacterium]|jgi:cysteine desulfurase/selenocysteine lyase|nr:cysteine desulfurase [Lachnospiraceae bacterium]HBH70275.1 cysteine desulfurase [Lachnospiraceae bacterium]